MNSIIEDSGKYSSIGSVLGGLAAVGMLIFYVYTSNLDTTTKYFIITLIIILSLFIYFEIKIKEDVKDSLNYYLKENQNK